MYHLHWYTYANLIYMVFKITLQVTNTVNSRGFVITEVAC